jgi:hypothetical protein
MLLLMLPMLIGAVAFFVYAFTSARGENNARTVTLLDTQLEDVNMNLRRVRIYLFDIIMNSQDIQTLNRTQDVRTRNVAIRSLADDFMLQRRNHDTRYSFLYWSRAHNMTVRSYNTAYMPEHHDIMAAHLQNWAQESDLGESTSQWHWFSIEHEVYLLMRFAYQGDYIAGWIPVKLLLPEAADETDALVVRLLDEHGVPLAGQPDTTPPAGAGTGTKPFIHETIIPRTNLKVQFLDWNTLDIGRFFWPLVLTLFMLLMVLGFSLYTLFYYRHYIQKPFDEFRLHIHQFATQRQARVTNDKGFSELNQAVDAFDSLAQQLQNLKIDMYEERLSHAKTELEFYQLQIKPHFFANCLSIIFSMAQKQQYERIQDFCLTVSRYVRYHFDDSATTIPLREELAHVRDYLDILRVRHRADIQYADTVDASLLDCGIPPLLLLTFVENAIRHSQLDPGALQISIRISRHEANGHEEVHMSLRDNGIGVSDAQLLEIKRHLPTMTQLLDGTTPEGGSSQHVGIHNIFRRLFLIFGDQFSLTLDKTETGSGLVVNVALPVSKPKSKK